MGFLNLFVKDLGSGVRAHIDQPYDDEGRKDDVLWSSNLTEEGYVMINNIEDFLTLNGFKLSGADFLAKKDCAKLLVKSLGSGDIDAGLDLVSSNERKIQLADMLIGSYMKRLTIYGGDFSKMEIPHYNELAKSCRITRFEKIKTNGHVVIPTNMLELLNDLEGYLSTDGKNIQDRYTDKGVKGEPYDDVNTHGIGISNYFKSLAPFDSNGFTTKEWTPVSGETMQQLSDRWCDILFEGGLR